MHLQGISIVDTRNLIRLIRQKYNFDFGNYALSAFRIKIMLFLHKKQLKDVHELMLRLESDPGFYDEFLHGISTPSTEAFRDFESWHLLRKEVFPQLFGLYDPVRIFFPDTVDGTDLYSMLIFLTQKEWLNKTEITVTSISDKSLNRIKEGGFNNYSLETARDNYRKLDLRGELDDFLVRKNNHYFFDPALLKKVSLHKQAPDYSTLPEGFHLIFFRNKLLNFSIEFQSTILNRVISAVEKGGFIVLGESENLLDFNIKWRTLKEVEKDEMIFYKI